MSKKRLGKGLGALISEKNNLEETESMNNKVVDVFIQQIETNPFQPRQEFDEAALEELARSIKDNGIIQPITLRQISPERYQLVTGERRWRAAGLIGLKKVPAIIRDYSDLQMMEVALIENLQREDLNPIEEAQAYQKMIDEFDMTQENVAQKVGKSRSSIANTVRLLNLAPKVQIYVSRETLSMGHARALLAIKDLDLQIKTADYIIKNKLSVRDTEKHIHNLNRNKDDKKSIKKQPLGREWLDAQKKLSKFFGTEVKIKKKKDKKLITIECKDYDEVNKLLSRINPS